jgi:hypothetical protein
MDQQYEGAFKTAREFLNAHAQPDKGTDIESPYARYHTNRLQVNWLAELIYRERTAAVAEFRNTMILPVVEHIAERPDQPLEEITHG